MRTKLFLIATLAIIASVVLGACSQSTASPAAKQPQVNEKIITVEVMVESAPVVVTAIPKPTAPPKQFTSKDPNTFVKATFGEPETFDPALAYDSASGEIIANVYETLIYYNRDKATEFIPQLALEVPSKDNGGISADGKTYTFKIRPGVKFHNGNDLTAGDVAYTFQRGLLQGGTASPQWLLTEPFFGIGIDDISLLVDPNGGLYDDQEKLKASDPARLKEACQKVTDAIKADDAAGTVTMQLAQPWGPFIPTLAAYWGSIMDQQWVVENGGWDGSCDTWQNFYGVKSEDDIFTDKMNGTGPFKLDYWTKGQEVGLTRNDNYWRTEPAWEGAPTGPAKLQNVIIKKVDEWGTRFAMVQAGDADVATVNRENSSQIDPFAGEKCAYNNDKNDFDPCALTDTPDQPLRLFIGYPTTTRTDVFFNYNINTQGGNTFIGSGRLDGNGIPADFFSDIHVRKAFNYCFDWDTFIKDALVGEAVQSVGIPIPGMPGFDPKGPKYTYDPAKCEQEFKASELRSPDGKSLWDTGFRMQMAYNTGNTTRQTVAEILSENLSALNEKFQIETIGLPWPAFLQAQRAQTLPLFISGWHEDIHDPHNWYVPYLTGTYGRNQSLPEDILKQFQEQINAGVAETDPARRAEIYARLNQQVYDEAPQIILALPTGRYYTQRWVDGWFYNPMFSDNIYYNLSKK